MRINRFFCFIGTLIGCCLLFNTYASNRTVNLVVAYKYVNFTGKTVQAIAVNNQIPAPTLHFKEGDHVTINVYNHLDVGTSIHWHGILVPWQMDGVEGISQKAIPPGSVFHYQFTLYQSGTYWYHAHAGFQEQQGLYGAFIIDPPHHPTYHYNKDFVVVLSDWSNTNPDQIYANLKKDGDYYSPRFPLQPSLMKFIHEYHSASPSQRKNLIAAYKSMEKMRMSPYDFSDIAYDTFLLNGESPGHPWSTPVKVGDVIRLRFIGATGSTIYQVKIPGTIMKMVQVNGNDVKPYTLKSFTIAPGETYDVLVHITKNQPYIIYAESIDTVGAAVGALITQPNQTVNYKNVTPFPEPAPIVMDHNMMGDMDHGSMNMDHSSMDMSNTPDSNNPITTGTQYQNLMAAVKTNNPNLPIHQVIHMNLSGYMDRYIWFINGVPEYKAKPILLEPGKRYRIIFTNSTMMHHPMHIHGHWFIFRNGHGAYDPLMHTVDVAPNATVVVDFDTDAGGQWFFHCHNLYHMMAGMADVFQYTTLIQISKGKAAPENEVKKLPYTNQAIVRVDKEPIDTTLVNHPIAHAPGIFAANFLDMNYDPFINNQEITYKGLFGGDYNKLELFTNEMEINRGVIENADMDVFYGHLISQFWAMKGGGNYVYRPGKTPYWQPGVGIEGLMPDFILTDVRAYDHDGSAKIDIELTRNTQITNNFFIGTSIRAIAASKTIVNDEIGSGVNDLEWTVQPFYRINPALSVYFQYQHTDYYAATRQILQNKNLATSVNTYSIGLALLF